MSKSDRLALIHRLHLARQQAENTSRIMSARAVVYARLTEEVEQEEDRTVEELSSDGVEQHHLTQTELDV